MAQTIQAPRGTADVMPDESYRWQYIEKKIKDVFDRFGYREIRLPTFEHTELFSRGVGDTTDIVGKEMYTFDDRSGRSITLRPEGTANTARALMQNGALAGALPVRAYYSNLSCFRYEKPQAGRLREFHQSGIELFGAPGADADAEVIKVGYEILNGVGLKNTRLEINSIGCPNCRPQYHEALRNYFESRKDELCETCNERLLRNPLRVLDCKSPACQAIAKDAPIGLDYLCDECADHFETLKALLAQSDIAFTVNPRIVRGLDYYTKTVFEFIHEGAGAQGTVCGGGRYDGLVELLGGNPTPGIGFGMGQERLLMILDAEGIEIPKPEGPAVFIGYIGERGLEAARKLTYELQRRGVFAMYDINGRSLKAQLKYADKLGAQYLLVLGDGELDAGVGTLRNMLTKTERELALESGAIAAAAQ